MSINMDKRSGAAPTTTDHFATTYVVPRVNLMPPEIEAERGFKKVQLGLGAVTLAVVGLVAGGFVWAGAVASEEQERLAAEQQRTTVLQEQQAEYAEVPRVLGELEAAEAAQGTAMASDVLWYDYLDRLSASYPKDVWLRDMNVLMTPVTPDAAGAAAGVPQSSTIGTVTFNGTGLVHTDVAAWLDALDTIEGFQNATYTTAERTELDGRVVVDFTSTVEVGPEALSLRFEPKAS